MMRDLKLHCRKVAQLILLIATKYIYYTHTPHIKRSRKLLKSQQRELSASLPSSVKTCTNFYDSNSLSFFTTQLQPSWPPRSFWKTTLAKFRKLRQNRTLTSQKFNILPRQSPPVPREIIIISPYSAFVFCFCVEDFAQQNGKIARQNERVVKSGPISAPGSTTWPTCAGWWLATAGTNLAHSFWGEIICCKCISDLAGR